MMEFLQDINWSPLWISLKTGVVATTIAFFLGIFCARKIMKLKPGSRAVLDGILTMPLVLPPTVAGFFLLLIFSLRRPFGKFLLENFDFKVVQTWKGCVIAAAVIAFPLMYRNARAAFEQVLNGRDNLFVIRSLNISMCMWQKIQRKSYHQKANSSKYN